MNKKTLGILAVLGGNVIFGFSFMFSRIALDFVSPIVLIALRFLIAFLILSMVILVGTKIRKKNGDPLIAFSLKGKPLAPVLRLAICHPVIYYIAENYGIKMTSSAFAGIMISIAPLVGIAADILVMKTKVTVKQVICAVFSIIGVALTTIGATQMTSSVLGLLILLIAVLSGTMFYAFSKKASCHYNPIERTFVMFAAGTVVYVILASVECGFDFKSVLLVPMQSPRFLMAVGYLAVLSSVAAFLLLNFGSGFVTVAKASLMGNLTTVISIAAGVILLHESMTLLQVVGAVVILGSVTLAK